MSNNRRNWFKTITAAIIGALLPKPACAVCGHDWVGNGEIYIPSESMCEMHWLEGKLLPVTSIRCGLPLSTAHLLTYPLMRFNLYRLLIGKPLAFKTKMTWNRLGDYANGYYS